MKKSNLEAMNFTELKAYATNNAIETNGIRSKKALIEVIESKTELVPDEIGKYANDSRIAGVIKINNKAIPVTAKTSIATVKAQVKWIFHGTETDLKTVKLTLPSGKVVSLIDLNNPSGFLKKMFPTEFLDKTDAFENERMMLRELNRELNQMPLDWSLVGTDKDDEIKAMFAAAAKIIQERTQNENFAKMLTI